MRILLTLVSFSFLLGPATLAIPDSSQPLKVLAPDLIIESAEQGEFLDNPADPRRFRPTHVVPRTNRKLFGWRMKVKTTRTSVLVQERATKGEAHGLEFLAKPAQGYIFSATDIVDGVSPGKYTSTLFVERVPVKTFTMIVK